MKQKTRKPKSVANTTLPTAVNAKDLMASIERSNRRERPTMDIQSRTSEVDYKQKYEQQKEEISKLNNEIRKTFEANEILWNKHKSEIHRLNSQVGGYKKNLNDSKDTIKALNADVNGLKLTNLTVHRAHQSLIRKVAANDVFISQLENDLRINNDNIFNLTTELKSIKSKWWYKLFN